MANAHKASPEVILNLDRPRKFLLNLRGLRLVEEKTGKSLFKQVKWGELGFKDLSLLLWAGLLNEDPDLTQDQCDELFDVVNAAENFRGLVAFVESAIERAMPNLTEEEAQQLQAQKKRIRTAVGMAEK